MVNREHTPALLVPELAQTWMRIKCQLVWLSACLIISLFLPGSTEWWWMSGLYMIKCYGMTFSLLPFSYAILSGLVLVEGQAWPLADGGLNITLQNKTSNRGWNLCFLLLMYTISLPNIALLREFKTCSSDWMFHTDKLRGWVETYLKKIMLCSTYF